jgi:hypothetical protein
MEEQIFLFEQCAKYEFASSNTTRTAFAFNACFVWKLARLVDERNGFFHRIYCATTTAIEIVFKVGNSNLARRFYRASAPDGSAPGDGTRCVNCLNCTGCEVVRQLRIAAF